jgi:hypothetical protein
MIHDRRRSEFALPVSAPCASDGMSVTDREAPWRRAGSSSKSFMTRIGFNYRMTAIYNRRDRPTNSAMRFLTMDRRAAGAWSSSTA